MKYYKENLGKIDGEGQTTSRLIQLNTAIVIILLVKTIGLSFPYTAMPYYFIVMFLFALFVVQGDILNVRINDSVGIFLLSLCAILYVMGVFVTLFQSIPLYKMNKLVLVDLANIFCLILLLCMFSNLDVSEYHEAIHRFLRYSVFLSFMLAIVSIYKFYKFIKGVKLDWVPISEDGSYPIATSLLWDYNIYSLGTLIGCLGAYYLMKETKSRLLKYFSLLIIPLLLFCTVLSASRRAILCIVLLLSVWGYQRFGKMIHVESFDLYKVIKRFVQIACLLIIAVFAGSYLYDQISQSFNLDAVARVLRKYSSIIVGLTEKPAALGERVIRLKAVYDMAQHYHWHQFILGNGFEYLNTLKIYPHNIFISAFLYAGVLGVVSLYVLYFYVISLAYKKRKLLGGFFLWSFAFVAFFYFFSGNSFFSSHAFMIMMAIVLSVESRHGAQGA